MPPVSSTASRLDVPPERRVLLCMGPGGVGKTTVAAALGLAAAEAGWRTIVVTIDPSRRLAQALGVTGAAGGAVVEVPGTSQNPLHCLLLDPKSVFDDIVRGYSRDQDTADRMLVNPIYLATVEHLGGALEFAANARVHMLLDGGTYDLVVLDTPPTANALEFLEAPDRIAEILSNPAARFLASSSRLGMRFLSLGSGVLLKALETLGGGPFVTQLGEFLRDFSSVLGEFRRRAGDLAQLLKSKQTGVVLATSATDFSIREAEAFLDVLVDRGMRLDGVVVNRFDPLIPPMPDDAVLRPAVAAQRDDPDAAIAALRSAYQGAFEQSQRAAAMLRQLEQGHPELNLVVLNRVDPPPDGLEDLRAMGRALGLKH